MKKLIMVVALFVLPVSADAQSCMGYTGPGGVCYAGPGGPMYDGPGGPAYAGPGGPAYDAPGGGSGRITICKLN